MPRERLPSPPRWEKFTPKDAEPPPPALAALVELLARQKITAFEFRAAHAYWLADATGRRVIEASIRGAVERAIIRNLIVKQMAPERAVSAAIACHPTAAIHRVREALGQLSEAVGDIHLNSDQM